MLMPSIFNNNLFDDDWFGFPFYGYADKAENRAEKKLYGHHANNLMKTDIKEMKDGYELEIDLPGFKKDEVTAELKDGYLTVSAAKGLDQDEQEKETGRYIRRERYAGACQRSYYVGEDITEEDIKAEFKHFPRRAISGVFYRQEVTEHGSKAGLLRGARSSKECR